MVDVVEVYCCWSLFVVCLLYTDGWIDIREKSK